MYIAIIAIAIILFFSDKIGKAGKKQGIVETGHSKTEDELGMQQRKKTLNKHFIRHLKASKGCSSTTPHNLWDSYT